MEGEVIKPPPTSKRNPKKSTQIRVKKYVPSQVLKDFSVENLETIPVLYSQTFIPKFLYLELIIIGVVFFITPDVRSVHLVCVLSLFFSFFFFLLFLSVFSLRDTNGLEDSRERRGNHFSCFPLLPGHEYSFGSSKFLPLLFNRCICNYQSDSWWDIFYLWVDILFSLLQLSRSYWLSYFKVTLWEFELISNYHPYPLQFAKIYKKWGMVHFFTRSCVKNNK